MTGSLTVTIADPDAGTAPSVAVTGPSFSQTLHGTTTLQVAAGDYTVLADLLESADPIVSTEFTPRVTGSPVTMTVGGSAKVDVSYEVRPTSGQLWLSDCGGTGNVFGTSPENLRVDGGFVATSTVTLPISNCPEGIAFDRNHRMWVGSFDGAIWGVDRTADGGAATVMLALDGGGTPASVAFAPNGDLWVTNWNSNVLYRWTAAQVAAAPAVDADGGAGTPEPLIIPAVQTDAGVASLSEPNTIAFDPQGNLWVSNQKNATVVKFAFLPDGGFPRFDDGGVNPYPSATLVDNGTHLLQQPYAVVFDREGKLWLSDKGSNSLYRIDPSTASGVTAVAPITVFKDLDAGAQFLDGVSGAVFDNSGNLWVDGSPAILAEIPNPTSYTGVVQPLSAVQIIAGPYTDIAQMAFDPTPPGLPINH